MLGELLLVGLIGHAHADSPDLFDRIDAGDAKGVQRALAAGADPLAIRTWTVSPGRVARFFGARTHDASDSPYLAAVRRAVDGEPHALAVLDAFLAVVTDPDVAGGDLPAPIAYVAGEADEDGAPEVMRRLLAKGADPRLAIDGLTHPRLDDALSKPELAVLGQVLAAGAPAEELLCGAAESNDDLLVGRYALDAGASPDARCRRGPVAGVAAADGDRRLAALLVERGADRSALMADGSTQFEAAFSDLAATLVAGRPLAPREEGALLAAWAADKVPDELVAGLAARELGKDALASVRGRVGAGGLIDAYADAGADRFVAVLGGPLGKALWDGPIAWPCAFEAGMSPRKVAALVGDGDVVRHGLIATASSPVEQAYLRDRSHLRLQLVAVGLAGACDPFGGGLAGAPRSLVDAAMTPTGSTPDRDFFPVHGREPWGDRSPWLVVRYVEGDVADATLDWRHW
jgi:hypothetical protein